MKPPRLIASTVSLSFLVSQLVTSLGCPVAYAKANTHFYTMSDNWNKRFKYAGTVMPKPVADIGFLEGTPQPEPVPVGTAAAYFKDEEPEIAAGEAIPRYVPSPLEVQIADLRKTDEVVELEEGQVITVNGRGFQRYLATKDRVVEFFSSGPDFVQIKGTGIGTTFVHLWDEGGRLTRQIRVKRAPLVAPEYRQRYLDVAEGGQNMEIFYEQDRSSVHTGNAFEDLERQSIFFTQNFGLRGDTPYGYWDSNILLRENSVGEQKLSELSLNLLDGRIGDFKDFNLHVADHLLRADLLTLPSVRLRGVNLEHEAADGRTAFTAFYGREVGGFISAVSPNTLTTTRDSFVGGVIYDFRLSEAADMRFGYSQAYGQSREERLKSSALEWAGRYEFGPKLALETDIGFDSERFAYTVAAETHVAGWDLEAQYRDYEKDFTTIVGNTGREGEQGFRIEAQGSPLEGWDVRYDLDLFRDRLFPAVGEEDRFNVLQDLEADYALDETSAIALSFRSSDETGRISPFRDEVYAASYRKRFKFWDKNYSFFTRFQTRDYESTVNPTLNYRNELLSFSLQTNLPWNITASVEPTFNRLEVPEQRDVSHPRATVYSLSQDSQIGKLPLFASWSVRFRDEEETESERSFMTGEDRLEFSGGLTYRTKDREFFVEAKYDNIDGEGATVDTANAEAELITGVRYFFDTGHSWQASGDFEGYVYSDLNDNGRRDEDEPGFPGLRVHVASHELTTDEAGHYRSPRISGTRATLILDDEGIPDGFTVATAARVPKEILHHTTQRVDFGLVARSLIGGNVFNDLNLNGRYDAEDEPVMDIRIVLDGTITRKTDRLGRYRFVDTTVGPHEVRLDITTLPIGYLPVREIRKEIELHEGVSYRFDFPVKAERILSGRVYHDRNTNGQKDPDEPGLPGAVVRFGDLRTVTDEEGYYLFDTLPKGEFLISVEEESVPQYEAAFSKVVSVGAEPFSEEINLPVVDRE